MFAPIEELDHSDFITLPELVRLDDVANHLRYWNYRLGSGTKTYNKKSTE